MSDAGGSTLVRLAYRRAKFHQARTDYVTAVLEARKHHSLGKVAAAAGVTKSAVAGIERTHRSRSAVSDAESPEKRTGAAHAANGEAGDGS